MSPGLGPDPAFLVCLPVSSCSQLGKRKSSVGADGAAEGTGIPEHEDTYGPVQQELNGAPEGFASFASSAATLLQNLGQNTSFLRSSFTPCIFSTPMAL